MKLFKSTNHSHRSIKGFTLIELLIVITIIGILANIGLNSFTSAQKKSRDAKRKAQLKQVSDALEAYYNDFNQYPADDGGGNLMACGEGAIEACTWGTSAMSNTDNSTVYMVQLPEDPSQGQAYFYDSIPYYGSNTKYQLYARLENTNDIAIITDEDNDDFPQVYQSTSSFHCGNIDLPCNYGVSSLNISPGQNRTLVNDPSL